MCIDTERLENETQAVVTHRLGTHEGKSLSSLGPGATILAVLLGGCGDERSQVLLPGASEKLEGRSSSAALSGVGASRVGLDAGPGLDAAAAPGPDAILAYALSVPPSTQCTIHPEGVTDPARTNTLFAGDDGEIRFDLLPSAQHSGWGTRLSLECSIDGGTQGTYLVDLNDSSTFKAKTKASLTPHVVGVRPALVGDLTAVSQDQLAQQGYPPRPDPTQPEFEKWQQSVGTPTSIYDVVPFATLGVRATEQ